jgi:hypothetical protein
LVVVEAVDGFLAALLGGMSSRDMRKETREAYRDKVEDKERVGKDKSALQQI